MPAEQLRGERVDPRADVFAFGCVLYEMLTNRPPFEVPEENAAESLLARVESGRYPRVRSKRHDVPRSIVRLVRQCLRPRAARRISSAAEARRRLESILDRPTTADCQSTLTSYLWDRHVFEPRSTETVVMVAHVANTRKRSTVRLAGAMAALVASLLSLGFALRYPGEVTGWTDELAREVAPIASRLASSSNP
jgi:serine/threonine protein kinase